MRVVMKNDESSEEEDPNTYCICKGKDDGTPMICCDSCNDWFHLRCIKLPSRIAKDLAAYHCSACVEKYKIPVQIVMPELSAEAEATPQVPESRRVLRSTVITPQADEGFNFPSKTAPKEKDEGFFSEPKKRKEIPRKEETEESKKLKLEDEQTRAKITEMFVEMFGKGSEKLSKAIENELFTVNKGVGKDYKQRFRTLLFNLKDPKNQQLRENVLKGSITPSALCRMTPAELAPKELAEYRKARDEKYLENIVIKEDEEKKKVDPRGEALLHTATSTPVVSKHSEEMKISTSDQITDQIIASNPQLLDISLSSNSLVGELDLNITKVDDNEPITIPSYNEFAKNMKSEKKESSKGKSGHKIKKPRHPDTAIVDDLLNNTELPPPAIDDSSLSMGKQVWGGMIKPSNTPKFKVNAFQVCGPDVDNFFDNSLVQVGRMDLKALYKYLPQLSLSSSRKLTIVYFEPSSAEESFNYVAAFESFKTSKRAAVIKNGRFKEAFVIPLAMEDSIPNWATGYTHGETDRLIGAFITSNMEPEKKVKSSTKKATANTDSPNTELQISAPSTPTPAMISPTATPPPSVMAPELNPKLPMNPLMMLGVPPPAYGIPNLGFMNPAVNQNVPNFNQFPPSVPTSNPNPAKDNGDLINNGLKLLAQLQQMGMLPPQPNSNSFNQQNQNVFSQQNPNVSRNAS